MEKFFLPRDVKVWGVQVKSFPEGIGEAFDILVQKLPGDFNRSFYGISQTAENGEVFYIAAAEELDGEEAVKLGCENFVIERGEYFSHTIKDWRKKTDSVKEIFQKMMKDWRIENSQHCVEWYKDDFEMVCLIKVF